MIFFKRNYPTWLTKALPSDLTNHRDVLIIVAKSVIIHYVEIFDCFNMIDFDGSYEDNGLTTREIKDVYHWFKWKRTELEKKIEDTWPEKDPTSKDWHIVTREELILYIDLETKLHNTDKRMMHTLANLLNIL